MGLSRRILCLASTVVVFMCAPPSHAAGNWDGAASELARKIILHTTPQVEIALEVSNQSSLGANEVSEITRSLRAQLRAQGARVLKTGRTPTQVAVTLSENLQGLLWVAEIRRGDAQDVVMIRSARPLTESSSASPETLMLRKAPVYEQQHPILDLAILEPPGAAEPHLVVLEPQKVAVYRKQEEKWIFAQTLSIMRSRPWPRDPRGRLVMHPDEQFDAYTPGTRCQGTALPTLTLECHASDDAWPLDSGDSDGMKAHFATDRNFFDGAISFAGQEINVPAFFSAASIPGALGTFGIFANLDGRARLFGKNPGPAATFEGWGSDIAALQTGCGSGWQILATRAGELTQADTVQAYSLRGREAVEAGAPAEFPGPVTALWPSAAGHTALAVARDLKTGNYEAFTLSISCDR
jgi:hypothetical protein